jgi:hypothetical protein
LHVFCYSAILQLMKDDSSYIFSLLYIASLTR